MTYPEILSLVFESGWLLPYPESIKEHSDDVETVVKSEASFRLQAGDLEGLTKGTEGTVEECVAWALTQI